MGICIVKNDECPLSAWFDESAPLLDGSISDKAEDPILSNNRKSPKEVSKIRGSLGGHPGAYFPARRFAVRRIVVELKLIVLNKNKCGSGVFLVVLDSSFLLPLGRF